MSNLFHHWFLALINQYTSTVIRFTHTPTALQCPRDLGARVKVPRTCLPLFGGLVRHFDFASSSCSKFWKCPRLFVASVCLIFLFQMRIIGGSSLFHELRMNAFMFEFWNFETFGLVASFTFAPFNRLRNLKCWISFGKNNTATRTWYIFPILIKSDVHNLFRTSIKIHFLCIHIFNYLLRRH